MKNKIAPSSVPSFVKTAPGNAAILSKLNTDKSNYQDTKKIDYVSNNIPELANDIKSRIKNNEDIAKLFPDVELAIQILTSSIISPNDMMTTNLIYSIPNIKLPLDVKNTIIDVVKKHIATNYDLEPKLNKILRDSLFIKGSYIEAIIPESSLDDIINSSSISVENLIDKMHIEDKGGLGILGNINELNISVKNLSTENFSVNLTKAKSSGEGMIDVSLEDLGLDITDNFNVLRASGIVQKQMPSAIKRKLNLTRVRSNRFVQLTNEELEDANILFKANNGLIQEPVVIANGKNEATRKIIGKPLVMELPVESCIPVHVANNPSKHLGYFILLDANGIPIDAATELAEGFDLSKTYSATDSKLNLISKASQALYGQTKPDVKLSNIEDVYNTIVDHVIKTKLKDGVYGDLAEVRDTADIYRVMLMRSLKAKKTRMLYLPSELVAYYAFDYRENGTGKSMLEKVSMLFSIRSILLFSKIMATIKNSISITKVDAVLDENDTDPEKTIEKIMSESLKTRQTQLPVGIMKVEDLVEWTHKVGFRYNFKHPALPDMTIDVSEENRSIATPDMELDEMIQKHIIMSFGLTPEIVESGYNADFATTVMAKNLLFAKRVTQYQQEFVPQIKSHISKLCTNDDDLLQKIEDILRSNTSNIKSFISKQLKQEDESDGNLEKVIKKEDSMISYMLEAITEDVTVEIANPEMKEALSMKESFDNYKSVIDEYTDYIINTDMLSTDTFGELSGKVDTVKSIIKATLMRKWMTDNNYLPELSEFLTLDENQKPMFNILDEFNNFADILSGTMFDFIKSNGKFVEKTNTKYTKVAGAEETEGGEYEDAGAEGGGGDEFGSDGTDGSMGDTGDGGMSAGDGTETDSGGDDEFGGMDDGASTDGLEGDTDGDSDGFDSDTGGGMDEPSGDDDTLNDVGGSDDNDGGDDDTFKDTDVVDETEKPVEETEETPEPIEEEEKEEVEPEPTEDIEIKDIDIDIPEPEKIEEVPEEKEDTKDVEDTKKELDENGDEIDKKDSEKKYDEDGKEIVEDSEKDDNEEKDPEELEKEKKEKLEKEEDK